ncbi:MAG: D-cysteine desulfhydrase, partial [uncultured Craurococcus sp.]
EPRTLPAHPPRPPADAAGADGAALPPPRRPAALDQAGRLHRPFHRRQQDAEAGISLRRGARAERRHPRHPGRHPVEPCPADRRRRGQARPRLPDPAGGPHRLHRPGLYPVRQRADGQAARRPGRPPPRRRRHAGGDGGRRRRPPRQGAAALCHPGRRLQPGRRARLCQRGAGAGGAGGGDGAAHRPSRPCHRLGRHPGGAGRRPGRAEQRHPRPRHRRPRAAAEAGGECAGAGRAHRRPSRPARDHQGRACRRQLRLCRPGLRHPDRRHGRGGEAGGAEGGHPPRPRLFGKGHGRADRPDPEGPVHQGPERRLPPYRRPGGAFRLSGGFRPARRHRCL